MNHRTLSRFALACLASTAFAGPVEDAESMLQRQQYKEAATALTDAAIGASSYARYLRAVALAESRQLVPAVADCDKIAAGDEWHRKALFLKAHCLTELKRHEEANAIYGAESARIFSTARSERLTGDLVGLAREIAKPAIPGQPISSDARKRAIELYGRAATLETGAELRESLLFETATLERDAGFSDRVTTTCEDYLREFDPDWKSATPAKIAGARRWEIRALLIENELHGGNRTKAISLAEDLLALWKKNPVPANTRPDAGDIEWLLCRARGPIAVPQSQGQTVQVLRNIQLSDVQLPSAPMAQGNGNRSGQMAISQNAMDAMLQQDFGPHDSAKHIESIRSFLQRFPNHSRSALAAWTLVNALIVGGKTEEAIAACKALYDRADWPAPAPVHGDTRPAAERLAGWRQEAFFREGELRSSLRQYAQAIEQWRAYIAKHPDGTLWQRAQASIIDAEFALCLDAVAAKKRDEMAKRFDAFIASHPLDARCAQLLFLNGQWHHAAALALEKPGVTNRAKEHLALYESAIAEWARLIAKHPQSEEASLALYRTGVIQADVLARHEDALATFQRLKFGSWQKLAAERAAMMTEKSLALRTPRTFRTNEPAHVRVNTRNIEKLRIARYTLNLEDYFRSRHRLDGAGGIGSLDIDLIQPDKTWEHTVANFSRLRPAEEDVAVPFDGAKPGVCIVRAEGDDWQASTIVIRSDVDVIVQAAWAEALVFVQDRVKGTVVANAEVLVSNGKEIIGTGRTGMDGVFRLRSEAVRSAADLCVFVRSNAGEAIQRLSLRGMTQEITGGDTERESVTLARRGYIYTDKGTYHAGETLHFRGIVRDVENGAYIVPVGREYEVRVQDSLQRVLHRSTAKLGEFGSFTMSVPLPAQTPEGDYVIIAKSGEEAHRARFSVRKYSTDEIAIAFETKPDAVFRGDKIEGSLRLRYSWGAPLAEEPVTLHMPDGRKLDAKTDADGVITFTQETTSFSPGSFVAFRATLPARNRTVNYSTAILSSGLTLVWDRLPSPALAGEAAVVRVKALTPAGKPAAAEIKLSIARRPDVKPDAVLSGLPGLRHTAKAVAPERVDELALKTDAATGIAEARPLFKDTAVYLLTARAVDARGNPVEISADVSATGADSPQKLLIFANEDEVAEGTTLNVDGHSRIAAPLALVTFAGENIIEHRVVPLVAGHNALTVNVASAHWPQFDVGIACLDGERLHRVRRGFVVKRPLKVELTLPAQPPKPGAEFDVVVTTKDAQGKPAVAELSIAMASQALFAQFPHNRERIEDVFARNLRRRGSLRSSSTAGFTHTAESRLLKRDKDGNADSLAVATPSHFDREAGLRERENLGWMSSQGQVSYNGGTARNDNVYLQGGSIISSGEVVAQPPANGGLPARAGETTVTFGNGVLGGVTFPVTPSTPTNDQEFEAPQIPQTFGARVEVIRPYAPDAVWLCPIVTDAAGRATVKLRAPAAGEWKVAGRGCTTGTNFGQDEKTLTSKDEFSIVQKSPSFVRPGDSFAPEVVSFGGAVDGKLTLTFGDTKQQRDFKTGAAVSTRFDPLKLPTLDAKILTTSANSGAANAQASAMIGALPAGETDLQTAGALLTQSGGLSIAAQQRQVLLLSLHDSPSRLLHAMALGSHDRNDAPFHQPRTPQTAASALLGTVSALRAGKDAALEAHARLLISALQITQRDGGWSWQDVDWERDSVVTSLGLWALVEARALGFAVEDAAVNSAASYLKSALAVIPPDEPEKAAVILHALAMVKQADFSVMNRLLRDRAKLNDPALAHLAAAFLRLEREDDAKELLKAIEARGTWKGATSTARLSRADDTTAIILYAASRSQAGSPLAKRAAESLVANLGVACGADSPLRGLWTASLAEHFIGTELHKLPPVAKASVTLNGKAATPTSPGLFQSDGDGAQKAEVAFDGKAAPILLATSVVPRTKPAVAASLPSVAKRSWVHEGLRHRDVPLDASSTSPVGIAAHGQRIRGMLVLQSKEAHAGYITVDEPLPAGCMFVADSLDSEDVRVEELPGRLRLWFKPGSFEKGGEMEISYELVALHPGEYSIPPTVVSDPCRPGQFATGPSGKLTVLPPGAASPDAYVMNRDERFELATRLFDEGKMEDARPHLEALLADAAAMKEHEREIARMMLWAQTARNPMNARPVVELFETLSERHPDLVIPFDRILKVAEAYRTIGEFERAALVHRATMESAFVRDAGVSAAIEAGGDFPGSVEHLLGLWRDYPDAADVSLAFFQLAQSVQEKAATPVSIRPGAVRPTKTQLLERSRDLLRRFVILRARDDLADDAAFSLANVYFDLKDYAAVVQTAGGAAATYAKSPFANSFHYMTALGHFWRYQFPDALKAAAPVAAGTGDDAPNARYITAQIHHAQEKFAEALTWYEKVKDEFPDAEESIAVLREKGVRLPVATSVKPGEAVKIELGFRNVREAALKIYRVDLMKLHERQKDLTSVSGVNLSGITPEAELTVPLGDGLDYSWKKKEIELPMKAEGAYLIICRGDSEMTSGLVLLTTLALDVHAAPGEGSVRVQVRDTVKKNYVADADIATYDSATLGEPEKGRSDPRGMFSASGIDGHATVVVKLGDARYAYHRTPVPLRAVAPPKKPEEAKPVAPAGKPMDKSDYLMNVKEQMEGNTRFNQENWEKKMKSGGKGVEAEKAFKK